MDLEGNVSLPPYVVYSPRSRSRLFFTAVIFGFGLTLGYRVAVVFINRMAHLPDYISSIF